MLRRNWKLGVALVFLCSALAYAQQRWDNGSAAVFLTAAIPAGTANIGDVDVLTFPDNEPFNQQQVAGTTTSVNSGNPDAGTQRIVTAANLVTSANNDGACVSVTTSSTALLPSFATRKWAAIYNRGTGLVYVKFGATATSSDFPVDPGGAFNWPAGVSYSGAVDAISPSGTQSVCVVEW